MESVRESHSPAFPPFERVEAVLVAEADRLRRLVEVLEVELVETDPGDDAQGSAMDAGGRMEIHSLLERCRGELQDIDAATVRLMAGRYGLCGRCGCAISPERLGAVPECLLCVECASKAPLEGARAPRG